MTESLRHEYEQRRELEVEADLAAAHDGVNYHFNLFAPAPAVAKY